VRRCGTCRGCSDANRKVLIKCVGENLLPAAQTCGLWRLSPLVAAPGTKNRHVDLFRHFIPGQALITKLHDLLCGGGVSRMAAATHDDAGLAKLMTHRAVQGAPSSAPIWRSVEPLAYMLAARLMSTAPP